MAFRLTHTTNDTRKISQHIYIPPNHLSERPTYNQLYELDKESIAHISQIRPLFLSHSSGLVSLRISPAHGLIPSSPSILL